MTKISSINTISFTGASDKTANGRRLTDEEKKEAAKKAVEGGGAIAATSKLAGGKKAGVDMFAKANEASMGLRRTTDGIKVATNTAKKASSLWEKCKQATRGMKADIIEWGTSVKASRYLKPLLTSKLFRFGAGFLGYGFGVVTLIAGAGDIANVATDAIKGNLITDGSK